MDVKIKHVICDNDGRNLYLLGANALVLVFHTALVIGACLATRVPVGYNEIIQR